MRTLLFFLSLGVILIVRPAFADAIPAINAARIVVPARDIARGETIVDSDLTFQTIAADRMPPSVATSLTDLEGKQTRLYLRAGQPVRLDEVRMPVLVTKGSTVTMIFDAPGIALTVTGKAMTEGGMGESVTVLNPISYRQVTGTVTGAGTVRAVDNTSLVTPTQLADSQP
ncbi:MAG: flagellar basal body P-ring formation chaperone FlgA [Rhizomicrobium sp.]|jgi:flagella basal body P-ring formation protein FlgA